MYIKYEYRGSSETKFFMRSRLKVIWLACSMRSFWRRCSFFFKLAAGKFVLMRAMRVVGVVRMLVISETILAMNFYIFGSANYSRQILLMSDAFLIFIIHMQKDYIFIRGVSHKVSFTSQLSPFPLCERYSSKNVFLFSHANSLIREYFYVYVIFITIAVASSSVLCQKAQRAASISPRGSERER